MKYLNFKITSALLVLLLVALVSCDTISGDPELPIPLEQTMSNTGAFLRIVSVESSGFDVADLATAEYAIIGEVSDVENGELVESIAFYASYIATGETSPPTVPETNDPISTFSASELEVHEDSGLPRGRFAVSLQDIMAALNLEIDDLNLGDTFNVRWEVILEDGRSFTAADASPAVGGGFYNSPYNANAGVVQGVPQDLFVGEYTITQNNNSATFNPIWSDFSVTTTLQVDPANGLNGRVMALSYLGGFPQDFELTFFRRQDFQTFTATDNWVSVPPPAFELGVGCSAIGLRFSSVPDETITSFDVNDDSQFTFAIIDNPDGDCGGGAAQVTFTATKN